MTNKELFYFVGKCLSFEEHAGFRDEIIAKIQAGSIDWEKFVTFGSDHLIIPTVYLKFKALKIIEFLPNELLEFFKEIYGLNHERNTKIRDQVQAINSILNRNNIYPTYLKGVGNLLDGLYSHVGERIIGDIDLLVPENDYMTDVQLMKEAGYASDSTVYTDVKYLRHYPPLVRDGFPASIEIHQKVEKDSYKSWFNSAVIETEKIMPNKLGSCYVLSDKHNIIFNFLHGQIHHDGHLNGIMSLRDLYDLYLLSKKFELQQTLQYIKLKKKAIAYFVFAGRLFGFTGKFYQTENISSRILKKKHDLNMNSHVFYLAYRNVAYFSKRIFVGYILQFFQVFYSRNVRQSVFRRLSNPRWYIAHFRSYTRFLFWKNS